MADFDLICTCQETLMNMDCQKYPASSLATFQAMLTHLINELPSLSTDERVARLKKFLAILEMFRVKYCNAGAVAETAAAPTAVADSDSARSAADCGASHSHKAAIVGKLIKCKKCMITITGTAA
jgi:hypothetical protein